MYTAAVRYYCILEDFGLSIIRLANVSRWHTAIMKR